MWSFGKDHRHIRCGVGSYIGTFTNPLHQACAEGDYQIVRSFDPEINHGDVRKQYINKKDRGAYPLTIAVYKRHLQIAQKLLEFGAKVDNREGTFSPLGVACWLGDADMTALLLHHGARFDVRFGGAFTPLHLGCISGNVKVVELLLTKGEKPIRSAGVPTTPLQDAVHGGFIDVVKLLLAYGADIEEIGQNPSSPLIIACRAAQIEMVRILLENKANVINGYPLHLACTSGFLAIAELLLDFGTDANQQDDTHSTPLHASCSPGTQRSVIEIVNLLLSRGANVNAKKDRRLTPLHMVSISNMDLLNIFIQAGADVHAECDDGTPLHIAAFYNQIEIMRVLLANGAKVDAKSPKKGETPLHVAYSDVALKLLISHGANVNETDPEMRQPIHNVVQRNSISAVMALVENGANVNAATLDGYTPLFTACSYQLLEIARRSY